ncbi:MAG: TonB-dependent receptor [Deltaproteobacteria bacterium]|nr:TonB-dependent receptor [Deltaproteobacteria bacterium]
MRVGPSSILVLACLVCASRARAEEAPEVSVKAKRPSLEKKANAALPIVVVGPKEIERLNGRTAGDLLDRIPGVVAEGPTNQRDRAASVRIRGFEPHYTLVLIDGERTTSSNGKGTFDLSQIPAESIERIEVVKGPMAVIWGSDAIGGAVNVVTRGEPEKSRAVLRASYGSFDTLTFAALGQAKLSWGWATLSTRRETSDGWTDEHDLDRKLRQITAKSDARGTTRHHALLDVGWKPGKEHVLRLRFRWFDGLGHIRKISELYAERGTTLGLEHKTDLDPTLEWSYRPGKKIELKTTLHAYRHVRAQSESRTADLWSSGRHVGALETADADRITDGLAGATSILRVERGAHLLTVLGTARWEWRTSDNLRGRVERDPNGLIVTDADFRDPSKIYSKDQSVVAIAVQDVIRPIPELSWAIGARGERHSRWGPFLAPATTLTAHAGGGVFVRYGVGAGVKTPWLDAIARPPIPDLDVSASKWVQGNPDLRPERSVAQEVAIGWITDDDDAPWALRTSIAAFRNDFRDKIQKEILEDWAGSGLPLEREVNIGRARTTGVELEAIARIGKRLHVGGNTTLLGSRNLSYGGPLDRTPRRTANLRAQWDVPKIATKLSVTWRYIGPADRVDAMGRPVEPGVQPALSVVDVFAQKKLGEHAGAFVQVFNALSSKWDRDGDGDTDIPPVNVIVGIEGSL